MAYGFLKFEVHDGNSTYFWFDNLLDMGRLIDITGAAGTTYLGLPCRAKVTDAVNENGWSIRGQRSRHYHDLYTTIIDQPVLAPQNGKDAVLWKFGDDDYHDSFSTSKTWEQIRNKREPVGWSKVIWFTLGVPRFSFITWLAVKNRLSTGDRMRSWGMIQGCPLCGEPDETRDHLFFACHYSFTVWHGLANHILGTHTDPDWHLTLSHLQGVGGSSLDTILIKVLLFQTTIYHLWREQNARRHHTSWMTADAMCTVIDKALRNRISSLKYKADQNFSGLMQRWFYHTM